ncbi:MAG: SDR family NAD(P)-dependent oxidoreductase [Myxococcota bacterium]
MSSDPSFVHRYGPWAVVTGASDGIGAAFARAAAARGLSVVLVARRADRLETLAAELDAAHGAQTLVVAADLATTAGVERTLAAIAALDVGLLIPAAGFGSIGPFVERALPAELEMVDLNVRAVVALAHPLGARMASRGRGGIVLLSSIVAFQGVPGSATYAATKAFVQSFAEALAGELRARGVDVVSSAPGPVHSGFADRAGMVMGAAATPAEVAESTLASLGHAVTVRPGVLAKALGWSLATLPRFGRVWLMAHIMAGMKRG